jgi:hypothetical protein
MKFQLYTYSLNPSKQQALIKSGKSKNEILLELFKDKFRGVRLVNGKQQLGFVIHFSNANFVCASIGKIEHTKIGKPPEENFVIETTDNWRNCTVLIDLRSDSQIIAFEYNSGIFKEPMTQLKILQNNLNTTLLSHGWEIKINSQIKTANFWVAVNEYKKKITSLEFKFAAPNVLDLHSNLYEANKKVKEELNATEIEAKVANPNGTLKIEQNQDFIKQSLEIAEGGTAKVIMKSGRKTIFNSDKSANIKQEEVTEEFELHLKQKNVSMLLDLLPDFFNRLKND